VIDDWTVLVTNIDNAEDSTVLVLAPPERVEVQAEMFSELPLFEAEQVFYLRGTFLSQLVIPYQPTSTPGVLIAESLVTWVEGEKGKIYLEPGRDILFDEKWGTIGRVEGGRLKEGQKMMVGYAYQPLRIDSVISDKRGQLLVRSGEEALAAPSMSDLKQGERRIANIWFAPGIEQLADVHVFPVSQVALSFPQESLSQPVRNALLAVINKLENGETVRILAWGDSLTVGSFLPNPQVDGWQYQFEVGLKKLFPKAQIDMQSLGWGGQNSTSFLKAMPGSPYNLKEQIRLLQPDLVVSEFVADVRFSEVQLKQRYGELLTEFKKLNIVWIPTTPLYTLPEEMGFASEKNIQVDPRAHVNQLRQFAEHNDIPLADVSSLYGQLWRMGIPYSSLLVNSVNHPNAYGMKLYAEALLNLFKRAQ